LITAAEAADVEPACRDVGGHQHRAALVGELQQGFVAVALLQIAVQRQREKPCAAAPAPVRGSGFWCCRTASAARRPVVLQQRHHGGGALVVGTL
jgi:hypothetical protein